MTLPISVISAFIVMNSMGMTLNVMTLMALSLSIGMLIDDAIVVRENIVRHLEMGKDHLEASRFGTSEIGLAVFATSLSIIAVFVPVDYMKGIVGRFFYQFGISVAFAVLVSLFVSFTLDPMLSSRWHDPSLHLQGKRKGLARWGSGSTTASRSWPTRYAGHRLGARHRKTVMLSAWPRLSGGSSSRHPGVLLYGAGGQGEFQVSFKTAPDASNGRDRSRLQAILASLKDTRRSTIPMPPRCRRQRNGAGRPSLPQAQGAARAAAQQFTLQREVRRGCRRSPASPSPSRRGQIGRGAEAAQHHLKGADLDRQKAGPRLKEELYRVPGIVDLAGTRGLDIRNTGSRSTGKRRSPPGSPPADHRRRPGPAGRGGGDQHL